MLMEAVDTVPYDYVCPSCMSLYICSSPVLNISALIAISYPIFLVHDFY